MLSVAVCDDNVLDCCHMAGRVKAILTERNVPFSVREFFSGKELLQAFGNFDLIFLDIMMQGMDGMETAQFLREKTFDRLLVFVSSSREFVFDAYDVEAFCYLVKPVEEEKLKRVLERAVKKLEDAPEEFILINKERQRKKLFLKDIYYFEIRGRVVSVHSKDGIFDYYGQIGGLERTLQGKGFFRCHKSFLVNLNYVDGYHKQELTLENGERIMIAKRRWEAFLNEMLEFMKKSGGIV